MPLDPNQAVPLKSLVFWLDTMRPLDNLVMAKRYWLKRDYEGFMKLNNGTCPVCAGQVTFNAVSSDGNPKVINGIATGRIQCFCLTLRRLSFKASHKYESTYLDSYLTDIKPLPMPNKEAAEQTTKILKKLNNFLWNPTLSALIHGNPGTGKTRMLQAIKTSFGGFAHYISFDDLFEKAQNTVRTDDGSFAELVDTLKYAPVLLLDDYGLGHKTEWSGKIVAGVINYRYNLRRYAPTIMTTNLTLPEITVAVENERGVDSNQRILSRMVDADNSRVMTVLQDDYRIKTNRKEGAK